LLVFDETQPIWGDIVPRKVSVKLQISLTRPLELTWEQFSDLANCCKELGERSSREREHRFGSCWVWINDSPPPPQDKAMNYL
jgi:hypothetical protein